MNTRVASRHPQVNFLFIFLSLLLAGCALLLTACGSGGSAGSAGLPPAHAVAPALTSQPSDQQVTVGARVVLAAAATGTAPLRYQWRKDGADLGGDSFACTIESARVADAGAYTVTVSNSAGSVTSPAIQLSVTSVPDWKGLTAEEEAFYGLNPALLDTDGDGISDYDEIKLYGFDPANDPCKFNPLVADVPVVKIQLTSPPTFQIKYEYSDGSTASNATERSSESSQSVTVSQESSLGLHAEATVKLETDSQGVEGTVGVDNVFTTSRDQANENSQALTVAQANELAHEVAASEARLSLTVSIQNAGHLAFTMTNLVLAGVTVDRQAASLLNPIGNLEYAAASSVTLGFPSATIAPGGSITGLTFANDLLYVDTAKKMLRDSSDLHVNVALYELLDPATGIPYNARMTEIGAKTATVLIDYDTYSGRDAEKYLVATNLAEGAPGVSLKTILERHLHLPYEVGEVQGNTGIRRLRTFDSGGADHSKWVVTHTYKEAGIPMEDLFDATVASYDPAAILVRAGDVVGLTYVVDRDGDGLPHRLERAMGTSDSLVDSNPDDSFPSDYAWYMAGHPLNDPAGKYQIIYNGNGATGGLAPSDLACHAAGELVAVAGNPGGLVKINVNGLSFGFAGWNTQPDGTGAAYSASKPLVMGSENTTLYAVWSALQVGDKGPAGGTIFFKKAYYSDGWKYLEAAPQDYPLGCAWVGLYSIYREATRVLPGATGLEIGDGPLNTEAIEKAETAYDTAADICANLVVGRYSDWFLPSYSEMISMTATPEVGLSANRFYWTSSQRTYDPASILAYAVQYWAPRGFTIDAFPRENAADNSHLNIKVRAARRF